MYAYSAVLLAELHLHPVPACLTASRRAAERSAQLQAVRASAAPRMTGPPTAARRLLGLVRPQRSPA